MIFFALRLLNSLLNEQRVRDMDGLAPDDDLISTHFWTSKTHMRAVRKTFLFDACCMLRPPSDQTRLRNQNTHPPWTPDYGSLFFRFRLKSVLTSSTIQCSYSFLPVRRDGIHPKRCRGTQISGQSNAEWIPLKTAHYDAAKAPVPKACRTPSKIDRNAIIIPHVQPSLPKWNGEAGNGSWKSSSQPLSL